MPKILSAARQPRHSASLAQEYSPTQPLKQKPAKRRKTIDEGSGGDSYVDSKASRKILKIGQALVEEDEAEGKVARPIQPNPAFAFDSRFGDEVNEQEKAPYEDDDDAWGDEEEETEEAEVDPDDLDTFNKFNPSFDPSTLLKPSSEPENEGSGTNLADLILEKIAAHEAAQAKQDGEGPPNVIGGGPPEDAVEIPAKVAEVYSQYAASSANPRYRCFVEYS